MRKNPLTTLLLAFSFLLGPLHADETTESNAQLLRDALFADEAERDLAKAEQGYREIVKNFDTDRVYAATAILRLAEILHQRGDSDEAEKWFARVLREFPDQEALVKVATARLGDKAAGLARVGPVPTDPQADEIARLTKLLEQSPDLLNTPIDGTTPLATAAAKGQLDVVNFLLKKGAKVNGDDNFPSALSAAVSKGHLPVTKRLLEENPDLLNTPKDGSTPLAAAAAKGRLEVIDFLLSQGAKVNVDTKLPSALAVAVTNGHLAVVERLIKAAAKLEPDLVNNSVQSGNYAVTELLLKEGAPANTRALITVNSKSVIDPPSGSLSFTYRNRKPEYAYPGSERVIMKKSSSTNATHEYVYSRSKAIRVKWTPLETAVYSRFSKLTDLLIAHGAKSQKIDGTYTEELRFAIIDQNIELVTKLLKNGADPDSQWEKPHVSTPPPPGNEQQLPQRLSALSLAAAWGNVEMTKLLIKAGANPNIVEGPRPTTPLYHANFETTPILIAAGANPNVKDESGSNTLHYNPTPEKLKALVAGGGDINALNNKGLTPLIVAVAYYDADLVNVKALIEAGADPNTVDPKKKNSLIWAASKDNLETVRYLLEKGAALEVAGKFAYEAAPDDSPTKKELFLKTYQQPERRRGTIRVVSQERGIIHEEVAALAPTGNELPICPYSLLEAYFFSNPDFNFTLGEVTIWREGRGEVMKFDLRKIITSGDPKQDVKLAWGDLVQFSLGKSPEDSAVNETEKEFLDEHLNREVQFNYIGKTRTIRMSPKWRQGKDPGLWLRDRWNNIYALTDDVETIALRPTQALGLGDESGKRYIVSALERNGLKIQLEPDKLATFWFEPSDQVSLSIAAEKKRSRYIPRPK